MPMTNVPAGVRHHRRTGVAVAEAFRLLRPGGDGGQAQGGGGEEERIDMLGLTERARSD